MVVLMTIDANMIVGFQFGFAAGFIFAGVMVVIVTLIHSGLPPRKNRLL